MPTSISERLAAYQAKCRPTVVLKLKEVHELLEQIEELEDSLAYEKARKNATGFKLYREFAASLKKEHCANV